MSDEYDWIYDRRKLSSRFNPYLIQDLSKRIPEKYPVYIRHVDTRVPYLETAYSKDDLPEADGYVAQKIVEGEKIQYDYTMKNFQIVERNCLLEHDGYLTTFEHESITIDMAAESFHLENGKIAIETIAGLIFRVSINKF